MRKRTFILLLPAFLGFGAQSTTKEDFAQFFVSEIHARGGRTLKVDPMPTIKGRWKVERDKFGFQIHLFDVEFEVVDYFLKRVLGEPKIFVPKNLDGEPQRMYDREISGMHIQLVGKKGEIIIVAVGPKKPNA